MRSRRDEIQQENGEHKCGGGSSSSHLCSVESAAACACLGPAQPRPHAHRSLRPAAAPRHLIMPCFTVQYPGFGTIGDPCARLVVATPQFSTCTPLAYTGLFYAELTTRKICVATKVKVQTACKRSKVARVGSKPRVHARVVAIGSPPRYAPTGPPSGVCSNVEKARHMRRGLNGGTRSLAARMHPLREPCRPDGAWMWATFIQRVPRSRSRISARPNSHFS